MTSKVNSDKSLYEEYFSSLLSEDSNGSFVLVPDGAAAPSAGSNYAVVKLVRESSGRKLQERPSIAKESGLNCKAPSLPIRRQSFEELFFDADDSERPAGKEVCSPRITSSINRTSHLQQRYKSRGSFPQFSVRGTKRSDKDGDRTFPGSFDAPWRRHHTGVPSTTHPSPCTASVIPTIDQAMELVCKDCHQLDRPLKENGQRFDATRHLNEWMAS